MSEKPSPVPHAFCGTPSAEALNRGCACSFLDRAALHRQLSAEGVLETLGESLLRTHPNLFSATTVFISPAQRDGMAVVVRAVEELVALPAWQARVLALALAPQSARLDHGPRSVFFGFDFHLGETGPQLIEINTNAGGFLLNAALARAQRACCAEVEALQVPATDLSGLDAELLAMFENEWRLQGRAGRPQRIAIVDESPTQQFLYPEFLLFQRLFERAGIRAVIADPRELCWEGGRLLQDGETVDLVYNRLTDFYLDTPENTALRQAFEAAAVVVTPHPRAHALYADKRHLATMSDAQQLAALGVSNDSQKVLLAGVPHTQLVSPANADALWAQRKGLFFKPASGFGSRAAYRGDKLTRRVWQEILAGDYVAQAIAPPSERRVAVDSAASDLKYDIRAYVYNGRIQLFAARLYAGQTTNFRTPGGGFAPVFLFDAKD